MTDQEKYKCFSVDNELEFIVDPREVVGDLGIKGTRINEYPQESMGETSMGFFKRIEFEDAKSHLVILVVEAHLSTSLYTLPYYWICTACNVNYFGVFGASRALKCPGSVPQVLPR